MGNIPLRLDSAGSADLKEMSTTEENYLAYQAGLRLAEQLISSVSALRTTTSGSDIDIGSHTDTVYDQNVGDHGTLTTSTTATTLYQKVGVAVTTQAEHRIPCEFVDNSGDFEIHEMDSSEHDALTDRLVSRIMTSEYPGSYRLGSSSPSGDYDTHLASVFSDTRTDGTTVNYNIYQRQTMTAPDAYRPISIKRSDGRSGTYQGLQEMTDNQIKVTFGQLAKTRIMAGSNGVGTYQLRSSAQGTPTDAGTWAARGTATDTRNSVVDQNYTRNSVNTFTRDSTRNSTADYQATFSQEYLTDFTGDYLTDYLTDYQNEYLSNFTRNAPENYQAEYTATFSRAYLFDYTQNFTRDSQRNTDEAYVGTFIGDYLTDYETAYEQNFTRDSQRESVGNFTRNSTRTSVANYEGGTFTRNFTRDSTRNSTRVINETFTGDFTSAFTGDFTGDFTGANSTRASTRVSTNPSYTGNFTGDFTGNFVRHYLGDFAGNFTRHSTRVSLRVQNFSFYY